VKNAGESDSLRRLQWSRDYRVWGRETTGSYSLRGPEPVGVAESSGDGLVSNTNNLMALT
jgi:hypothetical protein